MIEIKDYSDCPLSIRAGSYGGQSGLKDGIIINEAIKDCQENINHDNAKGKQRDILLQQAKVG